MKKILIAAVFIPIILILVTQASGITGLFYKAYTKSLSLNEVYEKNLTIKKFYNLTIRFQKYNSSSYLTIRNNATLIILKDINGNELVNITGMDGNARYYTIDKLLLDRLSMVSAFNISNSVNSYEDVINQSVDVSYSGLKATIKIKVKQIISGTAVLTGYVFDELTSKGLEGIEVLAFDQDSNPNVTTSVKQTTTTAVGKYILNVSTNSVGKTYDVYVKDYEVIIS